ncbi:MAG: branched-chain-amino-acid transaminase [Opitutales bacterium]|nr:branched-chain-amino-acid transaminase [Opitutales bacterium]MBP3358124.1 branched-chain-amino-acid transaminase [Opitutales bacterium]MBQ2721811.1 branched-chain-amino-acid transaminase [Opitutales bacterium]MBR7105574.1 branched-chain-amino-acid transaminase [Opitutales bacterium]
MKVYINGKYYDKDDAKVSVFDHGFLYGDGIFEGIRLYNKNVFKLPKHIDRLFRSARAIMLDMPWSKQEIMDAVCDACRTNNLTDGYIRLVVSRGKGALGLSPRSCSDPQLIIIADQIQLYPDELYQNGLKAITVPTRRNSHAALPPMVKSLNYLNNILAKIEAQNLGYQECLLLNNEGYVAECSGDNVFIAFEGQLITPPVSAGSLGGMTRQTVIELAKKLGYELIEKPLTRFDVWTADECFLTGTAAKLIPLVELDGRKIGTGKPGEMTNNLIKAFNEVAPVEGVKI